MTTNLTALPAPIRAYLTAHQSRDDDAAVQAFAPDATVTDEGNTHTGTQAIRAWRQRRPILKNKMSSLSASGIA